jgi:hypothetical protein
MAATSTLTLRVKAIGERSIDAITRKLARLSAATMAYSSVSTSSLTATDVKWKKHFDGVDKGIKAFGGALTKFVTMGAKFAALQVGVLGLAMVALHASFVLGNAAMKAFRFAATGAAGAAAGLAAAASIAAAAVREQQIAMYSYKGGDNYQSASVAMRALASDAELATVGAAGLNAVFAEVSKTSTFSAGSQNLLKGLMDFASAGKPLEEGAKSAGKLIAAMQDPKGSFTKMKEAAKELGPEMEKAIKDLGITSSDELKKAIMDGTLAAAGGVDGQFGRVNDTLVNRFKSSFALIKNDFADFGDPLLEPTKKMFEGVVKIFNNAFGRVAGDIAAFAQGGMFDDMEGVIGKLADFFVNFMRDYLPKVQGMMDGMGGWWDRFKDGWNEVLEKLRPLIDGARILEETFMRVFRPVGQALSEGFGDFNQQIMDNKDDFFAFGDSIGRFIAVMSKYAKTVREIFIDALPFLTKIIDGLTGIVDLFMSLLGGFRSLLGGGGMGSFMLLATMLSGGRAAKKTTGGFVASYKSNITPFGAGSGPLTGQTGQGNVTEAGRARAGRLGDAVKSQSVRSMTVARMIVRSTGGPMGKDDPRLKGHAERSQAAKEAAALRSASPEGVAKKQAGIAQKQAAIAQKEAADKAAATRATAQANYDKATGVEKIKSARALRKADKALLQARQGTVTLPQLGMGPATYKNNALTRNFRMTAEARAEMKEAHAAATGMTPGIGTKTRAGMQKIRQTRESYAYKRMFGGDIGTKANPRVVKGINNTMGASMGASVALGLAAKLAPESAQGALALGSMVSMVNPLAGLAVGVVGGLVMGIRGASAKKRKEAQAAASKEASQFANGVMDKFNEGIRSALDTGTFNANTVQKERKKITDKYATRTAALENFMGSADVTNERGKASLAAGIGNQVIGDYSTGWGRLVDQTEILEGSSTLQDLMALDQSGVDVFDADAMKDAAKAQRLTGTGHFGTMDQGVYDMAIEDIEAYWTKATELARFDQEAIALILDYGEERIPQLGKALNKSEEEIRKLADSIGLDLNDSSIATTEQLKKLSEAMINTKREMDIASQDRFAEGTDVFRKQKESLEAKEALNEGSFALRGQFNEGTLDEKTLMDFFENKRQQLVAYYKGDVQLAESEFNRAYGPNGDMYSVVGGALEGMGPAVMALAGEELTQVAEESRLARESNLSEFITAKAMGGSVATTVSGDVSQVSAALAGDQELSTMFQKFLDTIDLGTQEGQDSLQMWLDNTPGLEDFNLKFEAFVTPLDKAAIALQNAGTDISAAVGRLNPPAAEQPPDTRTPRGPIGDATSRNLGTTLSNHSAVNDSIPGKRNITSGYRNYALGSLKSDHVTGRALDMVGDNLVSYRDKMENAGGFAEFHGAGDTRHLHVVPPNRSLGDSMTAVSATSSTVTAERGGQTVSNSNNFYITGSNPQEIANAVIAKMAMINKSNGERR